MPSTIQTLVNALHYAPSADNSQPWHLTWDKNFLSISYDSKRVAGNTFPASHPATLLTMGACLENLRQVVEVLDIDFKYTLPTKLDISNPIYFQLPIEKSKLNTDIQVEKLPLYERHTNRLPYLEKPLPADLIRVLKKLTVGSARAVFFEASPEIRKISELVQKASEIRFRTREINEWLGKSLRFKDTPGEKNDGLDIDTLDLPPGGAAFLRLIGNWRIMKFLNLFGAYKVMSFADAQPIRKAPGVIAVISPIGFQDVISAGQLMNRIWIDLNANGLAVQPYYVVADQLYRFQKGVIPDGLEEQAKLISEATNKLLQLQNGEALQMLFRVGYPAKKPVKSKRISIEKIYTET